MTRAVLLLACLLVIDSGAAPGPPDTLRLHPENPHYFEWRGRPLIIIGSGEHYGAVLNGAINYRKYLATLGRERLNHTRLFTGAAYVEPQGAFKIEGNTLAPLGEHYLAPWARSDEPGYTGGGHRFDLERWDDGYFQRLRDFIAEAERNKVIVEVNLFCPFYGEEQWRLSPFHPGNNVNGAGRGVARTNVYTLDRHGGLLSYEERFVLKVVAELRQFGNFYYEICNEPYFGGVTLEWQEHMASMIADAQAGHPDPKLISQNIANGKAKLERPLPHVDIYNFHYASPPDTVALNWHLNRPIGDNETGFRGTDDEPYRMEAWDFIMAGGALFSHLDYSFSVGHEDGTFPYPATQPGGGGPRLRQAFRALRDFIGSFDFVRMTPDNNVIVGGVHPSYTARALVEPARAVAAYFRPVPHSEFSARWTAQLEVPDTGGYRFHATSNDGIRLWIDDRLVIDRWVEQSETEHSAEIHLEKGRHRLKAEYFYTGGNGVAKLAWSRGTQPGEAISTEFLRLPDGRGKGLRGEYFVGRDLNTPWRTRTDAQIDFDFGTRGPFAAAEDVILLRPEFELSPGRWRAEWIDPRTGAVLKDERVTLNETTRVTEAPRFTGDIALRLTRR
jgi:hypothetical protein